MNSARVLQEHGVFAGVIDVKHVFFNNLLFYFKNILQLEKQTHTRVIITLTRFLWMDRKTAPTPNKRQRTGFTYTFNTYFTNEY